MLTMTDVEVGYGRTSVVHGVTVEVPPDGVVAVLGHNGAGKTTLLRAAVELRPTRSGRVLLDGEDVTGTPPHRRVRRGLAYVPQGQQSFGQLTTLENLQRSQTAAPAVRRSSTRRWTCSPRCGPCSAGGPGCCRADSASNWPSRGR